MEEQKLTCVLFICDEVFEDSSPMSVRSLAWQMAVEEVDYKIQQKLLELGKIEEIDDAMNRFEIKLKR